jgi:L-lactate dehydrogenase complex protein LldG
MSAGTTSKRAAMLSAVLDALGARGDDPGRRGEVRARLERSPDGIIPERARLPRTELLAQFRARLEAQTALVHEVASAEELPQAIATLLTELELPMRLRCGTDAMIAALPWETSGVERDIGPAHPGDLVCLSRARAAAAETGTLFFASGPDNPTTLNFLPETHIAIVRSEAIAGSYEDAWRKLRAVFEGGAMPRAVTLVSGPSCTADIEQTLIRGAHGPRRLAVFIVG